MQPSSNQIKILRAMCHHLKPVIWLGQAGLTDNVQTEIAQALKAHELIKIKLAADADSRADLIAQIASQNHAVVVQKIGKTACFFKRNPQKIRIELPK